MDDNKIKRINELYKKQKAGTLTAKEKEEQAALRTIPIHGRYVFSTSPFEPTGAPKESLRDKIAKKIPKMPKIHLTVER